MRFCAFYPAAERNGSQMPTTTSSWTTPSFLPVSFLAHSLCSILVWLLDALSLSLWLYLTQSSFTFRPHSSLWADAYYHIFTLSSFTYLILNNIMERSSLTTPHVRIKCTIINDYKYVGRSCLVTNRIKERCFISIMWLDNSGDWMA